MAVRMLNSEQPKEEKNTSLNIDGLPMTVKMAEEVNRIIQAARMKIATPGVVPEDYLVFEGLSASRGTALTLRVEAERILRGEASKCTCCNGTGRVG